MGQLIYGIITSTILGCTFICLVSTHSSTDKPVVCLFTTTRWIVLIIIIIIIIVNNIIPLGVLMEAPDY